MLYSVPATLTGVTGGGGGLAGGKDLLLITTSTELLFLFQSYLLLVAKVILSVVPRPGYCAAIDDVQVCGPRQCE